jgi:hypothetical protein
LAKGFRYLDFRLNKNRLPAGVTILGEGFVGGKAMGLIFTASAVEQGRQRLSEYPELVKFPESTIISTGYFDRFMSQNRLQRVVRGRMKLDTPVEMVMDKFMTADFPEELTVQLRELLARERRPLAVRSSSFHEDSLHHSFAGIYQSLFIPNRGNDSARLSQLETAVRLVYLATFGDNAREYRLKHGIRWQDEKMGVLIQNLIGREYPNRLFYPLFSGVAFSKNFYPWTDNVTTDGGVARVVMGLGTRAVGRYHARVFSPMAPLLRPEGSSAEQIARYSQKEIDALNLETGGMVSPGLDELKLTNDMIYRVSSEMKEGSYLLDAPNRIQPDTQLLLTFEPMLRKGGDFPFLEILRSLLHDLEKLFGMPVDMEFAVNIGADDRFYILQVRPLGVRAEHQVVRIPQKILARNVILSSTNVLGNGLKKGLNYIVYVPLDTYRFDHGHEIARQIGEVNRRLEKDGYILIGPGRWATSHPDLGVPVTYAEISNAQVIVECSHGGFTPELSYGTHFFGDMVVSNILYIPVFVEKGDLLNTRFLGRQRGGEHHEYLKVVEVKAGMDVYVDGRNRMGIIVKRGV